MSAIRLRKTNRNQAENKKEAPVEMVAKSLSHEFGNILLHIIGTAELKRDGSPEEMRKGYEIILKAANIASHINKNFKNLLRNSDNDRWETLCVSDILDEAVSLLEHTFTRSQIDIIYLKKDNAYIRCVKSSLIQVFLNLLMNAYQAMDGGGKIYLSILSKEADIEIRIRDYGKGIAKEWLQEVTTPLFTMKKQGEGLGLFIAKEIVEKKHDGYFHLHTHGKQGVEVIIRIPHSTQHSAVKKMAA